MSVKTKDVVFVGIQFSLLSLYLFDFLERIELAYLLKNTGGAVAILGATVIVVAILQLDKNFSPFPTPKSGGTLISNGLYTIVRHPVYTGIILTTIGYGIYQMSPWKLIVTLCLTVLFHFKSRYEEELLCQQFEEYSKYKTQVGRLMPKVFV